MNVVFLNVVYLNVVNLTVVNLNVVHLNVVYLIVVFVAGADGYNVPDVVCDIYFDGKPPCFGGVMAIDGRTGKTIW